MYNHKKIEKKWQEYWSKNESFKALNKSDKEKYYILVEFPYPSGHGLHVGHVKSYSALDAVARMKRMQGYNVLFPMGWDAFGAPAEQYAIANHVHPKEAVKKNVDTFKGQLQKVGISFDWSREFATTDPEYYKWTQWQFLKFYEHDMAYKAEAEINWCPKCLTGLSNEDAAGGVCERCGTPVTKKLKSQWILRMSKYADSLLDGLKDTEFLDRIKTAQINWIGKSIGAEVKFKLKDTDDYLEVFTTRADTLFGATFMVMSPEHKYLEKYQDKITNLDEVQKYQAIAKQKSEIERTDQTKEKTGVEVKGLVAINPVNNKEIPIWISDYVLANYGTGAIMAVPAHDDRDYEFAKKFNIPIIQVIAPSFVSTGEDSVKPDKEYTEREVVNIILKHPNKDEYLVQENHKFNWTTLIMGGIEENETVLEAAKRELEEETGYTNVSLIKEMEFVYFDSFYARHKDVNRHIKAHTVVLQLNDLNQKQVDEKELDGIDLLWVPKEKLYETVTYAVHKYDVERLINGEKAFTENGEMINSEFLNGATNDFIVEPITGEERPEEKHKNSIVALVYNPKTKQYLTLNWGEKLGGRLLVGGTIEENETPRQCAEREILEETGYKNIKYMDSYNTIHHHYYAFNKKQAYNIDATIYYFELINEEQDKKQLEDNESFNIEWVDKDTIEKEIKDELHKLTFDYFVNKLRKFNKYITTDKREGIEKMITFLEEKGIGKKCVNYRLQDWIFSRQRFWGEPIPMIYCEHCGWQPVPYKDLPVILPDVAHYEPTENGESPLANITEWVNTKCPKCGGPGKRETDTMPNWAGSSWYWLRYMDPKNDQEFASMESMKYWGMVDYYNGGMEHATRHLLYARFWNQFLYDIGLVPNREPFKKRVAHGMILGENNEKMSKSRGNVVNPEDMIESYGADALRCYELFIGDYEKDASWSENGLKGCKKFLDKIDRLKEKVVDGKDYSKSLEKIINKTIKKVTDDLTSMGYNTAVSSLMILANAYNDSDSITKKDYHTLLTLLNPIAPHLTEELNEEMGFTTKLSETAWPVYDEEKTIDDELSIGVQVNGKIRGTIKITLNESENSVKEKALTEENVTRHTENKEIVKVIYIPNKIVNIIVK